MPPSVPRERAAWSGSAGRIAALGAACLSAWTCAAAPSAGGTGAAPDATSPAAHEVERDARRAEARFPNGRRFVVEIADTPARRERGYMFRKSVDEKEGMIFVFPESGFQSFWMKNTLVPLDMIWMDDGFTVVHLEVSVPPCKTDPCPSYGPLRKARYVLEIQGGIAAREGVKVGDRLRISFPQ